jgi:hypothetical protein
MIAPASSAPSARREVRLFEKRLKALLPIAVQLAGSN